MAIDLGTLGSNTSAAYGVSARGQVVGWSGSGGWEIHAFLWEDGMMIDLGTLGGGYSWAHGINARGHVGGSSVIVTGQSPHATLWMPTN